MLPFHPGYGLADETRLTIIADAERLGVVKAAELHGVAVSSVYLWRKRLNTLPPAPPVNDLWR